MVGVALPSIRADLGLSTASLQWVVSGYVLGYGGLLLLGRPAPPTCSAAAGCSWPRSPCSRSPRCSAAWSAPAPCSSPRAWSRAWRRRSPPRPGCPSSPPRSPRARPGTGALSIYSAFGAGGFSLGLVLSGLLTEINWRWTLLLPAPRRRGLVLVAAIRLIPRDARTARPPPAGFDLPGAVTVTAGDAAAGLRGGQRAAGRLGVGPDAGLLRGAPSPCSAAFLDGRAAQPRSPAAPGHLPVRALTRANLGAMVLFGSYVSFQFLVTQYLQIMAGWSALATALAFLPGRGAGRGRLAADGLGARPVRPRPGRRRRPSPA